MCNLNACDALYSPCKLQSTFSMIFQTKKQHAMLGLVFMKFLDAILGNGNVVIGCFRALQARLKSLGIE